MHRIIDDGRVTTVYLPADRLKLLQEIAQRAQTSVSAVIRSALDSWLRLKQED